MSSQGGRGETRQEPQVTPVEVARPSARFLATPVRTPALAAPRPPAPPPRRELTTRESLSDELRKTEQEIAQRREPPPPPAATLEFVALELIRQRSEMAALKQAQTERRQVAKRSFNMLQVIAAFSAFSAAIAPLVVAIWGEWIKRNPEIAATGWGSFMAAVVGVLAARRAWAGRARAEETTEEGTEAIAQTTDIVPGDDAHR